MFNLYPNKNCVACGSQNTPNKHELNHATKQMNGLYLNPSNNTKNSTHTNGKLDSNNNNSDAKYSEKFKTALSNISNDVKQFFNGLSPISSNGGGSGSDAKNGYDADNSDVIEIDPKTNKPVRTINGTKAKKDLGKTYQQWACGACTFSANPDWNSACEICGVDRVNQKQPKDMRERHKTNGKDPGDF